MNNIPSETLVLLINCVSGSGECFMKVIYYVDNIRNGQSTNLFNTLVCLTLELAKKLVMGNFWAIL